MIIIYLANYSRIRFDSREYVNVSGASIDRLQRMMWKLWRKGKAVPGWIQGGATWLVIGK